MKKNTTQKSSMKIVQHGKRAVRKEHNMEVAKHKCNMKKVIMKKKWKMKKCAARKNPQKAKETGKPERGATRKKCNMERV